MAIKPKRENFIPTDYQAFKTCAQGLYAAFISPNRLSCIAFKGRAAKPDFFFNFRTTEALERYVGEWVANLEAKAAAKAQAKAEQNAPHTLAVGDVLFSSWGYEQTNIEFYQVTAVIGAHTVEIAEIDSARTNDGGDYTMSGTASPILNKFIGGKIRKKANGLNQVKLNSFSFASPLGFKEEGGRKFYDSKRWTSYA